MKVKEHYLSENIRVSIRSMHGKYVIEADQRCVGFTPYPWEVKEDGWRNCTECRANTYEEAIAEYHSMIDSYERMGVTA